LKYEEIIANAVSNIDALWVVSGLIACIALGVLIIWAGDVNKSK
jgi:hypothetical protein